MTNEYKSNSSHLSSGQDMSCQLHLGEIPLPNGLEEAIIANVGVLLRGGERVATSRQAVATCRFCRGNWGFNKAIHRRVLQKSHTSGNQQHPHSQPGILIYIDTNTTSLWTSLAFFFFFFGTLQKDPYFCYIGCTHRWCSKVLQWRFVCAKAGIFPLQSEMNPLTEFQVQEGDLMFNACMRASCVHVCLNIYTCTCIK